MADPFNDALTTLASTCPGIMGVAFTDLDGEDIALHPPHEREALRICAAYGGIALRRLNGIQSAAHQPDVQHVELVGEQGTLITLKVGDDYQLIVTAGTDAFPAQVLTAARATAELLLAQI